MCPCPLCHLSLWLLLKENLSQKLLCRQFENAPSATWGTKRVSRERRSTHDWVIKSPPRLPTRGPQPLSPLRNCMKCISEVSAQEIKAGNICLSTGFCPPWDKLDLTGTNLPTFLSGPALLGGRDPQASHTVAAEKPQGKKQWFVVGTKVRSGQVAPAQIL